MLYSNELLDMNYHIIQRKTKQFLVIGKYILGVHI